MTRIFISVLMLIIAGTGFCAAAWQGAYEGDALPAAPINATSEVTHFAPDDVREIVDFNYLHIIDTSINRSRYRVDLDSLYGAGVEAGTIETRQRFVASSDMNNIAIMMRQDTAGASAEIRVGCYDAGDGRRGLWDAKTGEYLGPIDPAQYYKLRMVLDGASGGRLYVNDSYFANLTAAPGGTSRLAFGAGSTLGTGEVYIDYFRWQSGVKAGPGEPGDPADPGERISPRITAPLPSASPNLTSVTVTWTTDVPTDSKVRWGIGWTCSNSTYDATPVTNHSVQINGLAMGTTHRFYVESSAGGADIARSGIRSVTTLDTFRIKSGPFVRMTVDGTSATVSWDTTLDSDSKLFFRPKGATTWSERYSSTPTTWHALSITDLTPNSTYEYYVLSTRPGSPDAQSEVGEFFTYVYSSVGSFLTNGGFELGNIAGWETALGSDSGTTHSGPWFDQVMPHSGNFFLGADSNGGARNGIIYQSVTGLPASTYIYATAWIYMYELDAAGVEEHDSAYCQIGIDAVQDPASTIDPNAATIRWSAPVYTANAGPWTCIGVMVPREGSTYATVFVRHVQSADGGLNVTCFDDVVLTTSAPANITSGPTVTAVTPGSATIEWTTDVSSTSFVQFGPGTLAGYQYADHYVDATCQTVHSATIIVPPGSDYVFQVGSATPTGLALSLPGTFTAPMNEQLENTSFEATDSHGRPTLAPWKLFQYNIGLLPRFYDPSQPAGGPIDGLVGPYPAGGATWHGITCEPGAGSHFIGAFADQANKNGGVYQRVKVTPGETYVARMRFLTRQDPIDDLHPADYTACAIAIDPTGGTDVFPSALVWSSDKTSLANGEWDEVSTWTTAISDIVTVFCVIEQRYANTTHLNAIDSVSLEISQNSGRICQIKRQPVGMQVSIQSQVVTQVRFPESMGMPVRIYVEEQDRTAGIAVLSTDINLWFDPPNPGDKISADGTLDVVAADGTPAALGELVINYAAVTKTTGPFEIPKLLIVTNRYLGGGTFGSQHGVFGGRGLSNVGLLVKVTGRVTSGDSTTGWVTDADGNYCAYIDDGSGVQSGFSVPGIKIVGDSTIAMLSHIALGDAVAVTGISSVQELGGALRPVILPKDWTVIEILHENGT